MNKLLAILLFSTCCISLAYAAPKASISVTPLTTTVWPAQYRLTFSVPKNHHAYLDKGNKNAYIPISVDADERLAASGLSIRILEKPDGVYDTVVKANVLRDQGLFTLELNKTVNRPETHTPINLELTYQLCNEVTNVCFRPQTVELSLPLPDKISTPVAAADDQSAESFNFMDKILKLFENNQDNVTVLFGLMFLAGLLSVATPCVYPMLPITSMLIVARADGIAKKEKQHALAYLIGIVGSYMALGLIAGMTGGAFNTFMQSAIVNIGFAVFFAFFAISLLGFYELSFMQNEVHSLDQQSSKIKGLGGTLLMGTVAGLVISPCVGPIVFALLLQVADNIAEKAAALASANQRLGFFDKLTIASQGSLMMSGFGLGVGLPFFVISVIKFKKLPRAGYWMNKIKHAFGFMILYFAYLYLEKGLGILGVESKITVSLAIGLVAIWVAVVNCHVLALLPKDALPNQKIQHYVGVLSMIVGGWLVIAGLGQMPFMNLAQADLLAKRVVDQTIPAQTENASTPMQHEAGISWYRSYDAAIKIAQQTGKPIFIDFYASWCANCAEFKKESSSNSQLNQALREKAIAVKLIDKEPEFERFRASKEHRQLKIGLPYFAIITSDGKLAWSGTDYKATARMVAELDRLS
jgi:thioredoxin:protein disulfide reductase